MTLISCVWMLVGATIICLVLLFAEWFAVEIEKEGDAMSNDFEGVSVDEVVRTYQAVGIRVRWRPALCEHCGICAAGLPAVFRPDEKPWVHLDEATPDEIKEQVKKCPSGALKIID